MGQIDLSNLMHWSIFRQRGLCEMMKFNICNNHIKQAGLHYGWIAAVKILGANTVPLHEGGSCVPLHNSGAMNSYGGMDLLKYSTVP